MNDFTLLLGIFSLVAKEATFKVADVSREVNNYHSQTERCPRCRVLDLARTAFAMDGLSSAALALPAPSTSEGVHVSVPPEKKVV